MCRRKFYVAAFHLFLAGINTTFYDTAQWNHVLVSQIGVKVVVSDHWANGGAGAADLAQAVVDTIDTETSNFKPLYPDDMALVSHWQR